MGLGVSPLRGAGLSRCASSHWGAVNPHVKYIDFNQRGYMLVDVTPQCAVCEWWYVDTVIAASNVQAFGTAFEVQHGSNRLAPSAQTAPRTNPPALAP